MANLIPPEIWFHVAKFIPTNDLRNLLQVNSVFFNLAMDIRYRVISINTGTLRLHQPMKTLKRVSDPFIASRVHWLRLSLSYEPGNEVSNISSAESKSGSHGHIRRNLQHTITRITSIFGGSKSPWSPPVVTFTDLINEIINITNKLVNLHELNIYFSHCPFSYYNHHPLFSSFWSSFGPKLSTLSFDGNLEGYRIFINSNPVLDGLQKLRINVDSDGAFPVDVLMPFINNLAPHLTTLIIVILSSEWVSFDLSAFFSQLPSIPGLTTLNVETSSSALHSQVLDGPIHDSSCTLQRVNLHLTSTERTDMSLGRWFLECISDGRLFSRLQVLDIFPSYLPTAMEFLLSCIQRTSETLVELTVSQRCLQDREIEVIVDALSSCSNLRYLRLNIWRLNVGLIDRLAFKLPTIDRLWLSIGKIGADDPNYCIDTFIQDLSTRSYTNWKLKAITIYQKGREADSDITLAIARSIPPLSSTFSSPYM